jgi:selenocysteine lyase/cysteine desulfurase
MDVNLYRHLFPVTRNLLYLDHAGVAPLSARVREAVERFVREATDTGALHSARWSMEVEQSRVRIAQLLGADPRGIAFVRSTSHGLSLIAQGLDWRAGDNVVTASCEFPANVYPWMNLARRGVETRLVEPREGRLHRYDLEAAMDHKTRLLALSWVEFANGFRNDLYALGEICRRRGVLFSVDAIQGVGAIPLNLHETPVDFLAADGHKWLLAPEGIGFLYVSPQRLGEVHPVLAGWNSVVHAQEFHRLEFTLRPDARKFEEGSLNAMSAIALGAAVELLLEVRVEIVWKRILDLTSVLIEGLRGKGYPLLTPLEEEARSGILTFQPREGKPLDLVDRLRQQGAIAAARGGGIRLSPHFYQTEDEMEAFLKLLP